MGVFVSSVCVRLCVCSHVVFFAFLLWLFPYPIGPSFDNKGFSSVLFLCSQLTVKYRLDLYQCFCMNGNLTDLKQLCGEMFDNGAQKFILLVVDVEYNA